MSQQEKTEPIEWVAIRFTVSKQVYEDVQVIRKNKKITMAQWARTIFNKAIEAESNTLPVGSKRKKED